MHVKPDKGIQPVVSHLANHRKISIFFRADLDNFAYVQPKTLVT